MRRRLAEMRKPLRVGGKRVAYVQVLTPGRKMGRKQGPHRSLVATKGHECHVVSSETGSEMVTRLLQLYKKSHPPKAPIPNKRPKPIPTLR